MWSGRVLSAKRLEREQLMPFGFLGAVLLGLYSVGATVYVPHLFDTYATRYGVIGAVFAMISAFFVVMVILVVSAAAGREVRDELDRIRRGERPAAHEVERQWAEVPPRRGRGGRRSGRGERSAGPSAAQPEAARLHPASGDARGAHAGEEARLVARAPATGVIPAQQWIVPIESRS